MSKPHAQRWWVSLWLLILLWPTIRLAVRFAPYLLLWLPFTPAPSRSPRPVRRLRVVPALERVPAVERVYRRPVWTPTAGANALAVNARSFERSYR